MLFSIEGSIACGKSTLLHGLAAKGAHVFPEPTETWRPWLEEYYASTTPEAALTLQRRIHASLILRHHMIAEVRDRWPNGLLVMERSLFSAGSLFSEVNSRLRPHPGWKGVKEAIENSFAEYEKGKVIAIALRLPFAETVRRSIARGDPDIVASIHYKQAIHDRTSDIERSGQQIVVDCMGATPHQVLSTVEKIIHQQRTMIRMPILYNMYDQ